MAHTALKFLWQMSWQVTLLTVAVWIITALCRTASPRLRYCLWMTILVRLCLPAQWHLPLPAPKLKEALIAPLTFHVYEGLSISHPTKNETHEVTVAPKQSAKHEPDKAEITFVRWLWIVGLFWSLAGCQAWRMRRQANRCPLLERDDVSALLERLRSRLQLRRVVACRVIPAGCNLSGPSVFGLFRPTILLPSTMADGWTPQDLEPVLLHELIHIRRMDLWTNWFQILIQGVFFFHPAVWFVNFKIRREREWICDDLAVEHLDGQRSIYCRSILRCIDGSAPAAFPMLGMRETKTDMGQRLIRIMKTKQTPRITGLGFLVIVSMAAASLLLAAERSRTPIPPNESPVEIRDRPDPASKEVLATAAESPEGASAIQSLLQEAEEGDPEAQTKAAKVRPNYAKLPRVKIDSEFLSVTEKAAKALRVDWLFPEFGDSSSTTSPKNSDAPASVSNAARISHALANPFAILTASQTSALLKEAQNRSDVEVLASPNVVTFSSSRARFSVDGPKQVVTGVQTTANPASVNYQVSDISFGNHLEITPYIFDDGYSIQCNLAFRAKQFVGYADTEPGRTSNGLSYKMPKPLAQLRRITGNPILWDGQSLLAGGGWIVESDPKAKKTDGKKKECLLILITFRLIDSEDRPVHRDGALPFNPDSIPSQTRVVQIASRTEKSDSKR